MALNLTEPGPALAGYIKPGDAGWLFRRYLLVILAPREEET